MTDKKLKIVGTNQRRVDGYSLVTGKPVFVDDFDIKDMLYAKILYSPHPHALIKSIDKTEALKLDGVVAILTYKDIPHIPYTTAGQGHPEPSPYDTYSLDSKVRFVGDNVAVVAAETEAIAERALELIKVEYEILPAILDMEKAIGGVIIHDEEHGDEGFPIHDAKKNIAAYVNVEVGDIEKGFEEADLVMENEYRVHYVQHAHIEPHICITYLDENGRLVILASTQVPWHVRRIVARLIEWEVSRVRVIKPRVGGAFGGKQEVFIEDLCAHLTVKTGRPVRLELTRAEEFYASRTRHPQILKWKTGVKKDGTIIANQLILLANTGAYGSHALTVQCNTGSKSLPLYRSPNMKFEATVVYTNLPVAAAFRAYGAPQGYFAMECQMDEIAYALGIDPLDFRDKNHIQEGDSPEILKALGEGREGFEQVFRTCGLNECAKRGRELIEWDEKRGKSGDGIIKRGIGGAYIMQGSGIPGIDMGAASIKINDDGSFNLLVGATDLGTGSDTVLAQIAAEVLDVPLDKFIVYSSDTDLTPFDAGAYASSTTYITGGAVIKAAKEILKQIYERAALLLKTDISELRHENGEVIAKNGEKVTYSEIALHSLYFEEQLQIIATASNMSYVSPPPFGAQFVELTVDTETGVVEVQKVVSVIDCGRAINPPLAEGQIEGAVQNALGYALTEEMIFDDKGNVLNKSFLDYKIFSAIDMPEMITELVTTIEPTGPYGAKSVSEMPVNGIAPAVANAIFDAIGIRIRDLPFTAERVLKAIKNKK